MARLMSLVSAVFITVPVIAPSLGQAVLLFAGWRWIFVLLAGMGLLAAFGSGAAARDAASGIPPEDRSAGDRAATCVSR